MGPVEIHHAPGPQEIAATLSVAESERLLSDWFEADVVLTSSGRAATLLYLTAVGLNRYRDTIAVPRMISACVLDAVIRRGFPVDAGTGAQANLTILYHQYGIPQAWRPTGAVLEDIAHAFFAGPETGARAWSGQAAVFSLPKFFATSTMSGGLVVHDPVMASRLRDMRDMTPASANRDLAREGEIFRQTYLSGGLALETVYLARLIDPRLRDDETGGLPRALTGIRDVGGQRRATLDRLLAALPPGALPPGWRELVSTGLPFVLPVFGPEGVLTAADRDLAALGVGAGVYRIDIARRMDRPDLRPALLVPCHQGMPPALVEAVAHSLASHLG
ncbi:MAG: hypothetical protein R3D31_12040 [Hyphomicrobiaceae bacterium]